MNPPTLDHLKERVDDIKAVSGKVAGQLRFIRDDLAPMIEKGLPLKYVLAQLAALGITQRLDTLRRFVRQEFPDAYVRYYAQKATAEKLQRQRLGHVPLPEDTRQSSPPAASEPSAVTPAEETPAPRRRHAERLDINDLTSRLGDFAKGRHFTNEKEGNAQ